MTLANPLSDADSATVERLLEDDKVREWIAARQPKASPGFWSFLRERETLRLLLTAALIPGVSWLLVQIYAGMRDSGQADSVAAAARLAETQDDAAKITALMPMLAGSEAQRRVSFPVLLLLRKARLGSDQGRHNKDGTPYHSLSVTAYDSIYARGDSEQRELLLEPKIDTTQTTKPAEGEIPTAVNATSKPGVVYMQIYSEDQRSGALALANALRIQDIPVPGIENVLRTNPNLNRDYAQRGKIGLRYYRAEDKPMAEYVATILPEGASGAVLQQLSGTPPGAATGLIEVWFPCGPKQGCN